MRVLSVRQAVASIVTASLMLLPWVITSRYSMGVVNIALITLILVLGLNIAKGYCGLISVGHAGFWGVGAYTAALLAVKLHWPFVLTLPAAVVLATAAGALVGIPALRLRGLYLAMATIGFTLMVQLTALNWHDFTGGSDGIRDIPPPSLGPLVVTTPRQLYYLLLVFAVLAVWFSLRIETSRYGWAMRAINSHEVAAELMGVDTFAEKVRAFSLSAALAGVAGALYAHGLSYISPEQFGFEPSVMFMVMLVIGGLGTVSGALGGVLMFTVLPEWLRPLHYWYMAIFGAGVMLFALLAPGGLVSLARRWLPWLFPAPGAPDAETEAATTRVQLPRLYDPTPGEQASALTVRRLSIHFGGLQALDDVDLTLVPGKIHALIGPNGAGKTTLVNCITGAYTPSRGTVQLNGRTLAGLRPHQVTRLGVARTFQNLALWKDLSILHNLLIARHGWQRVGFWPTILGTPAARAETDEAQRRAQTLLRAVGLWGLRSQPVGSLPFGHQKLVEIARALMTGPRVLLLDEPAAGLTRPEIARLMELMRVIRDQGTALLLIEHNMELVMDIADHITVLHFGQCIAAGAPEVVRRDPAVIEAYLGAADLTFDDLGTPARMVTHA